MLLQRSKLAAATVERPRLASPWSIALLAAMLLALLAAIYPHQALVGRVLNAPANDLTEAYLVNLLRTDPQNPKLRLVLARNQFQAGLYDRVRKTLAPALEGNDPNARQEAVWLLWQSEETRYRRLPEDSPQRAARLKALRLQLSEIAEQDWSDDFLAEIARKALAFGDTELGLRILQRLASRPDGKGAHWYEVAAQSALANGEYRAAAGFYLIIGERATDFVEQRRNFLLAMRTLQSGDRMAEALEIAERQLARNAALANDSEVLELLVQFARAARRPDLADKYARRLLRLSLMEQMRREQLAARGFDAAPRHVALSSDNSRPGQPSGPKLPFDDRIYTLGYDAFLDNRNLEDAWKVAASAVRQAPDNIVWRERLARVSEWSGRPRIALEHWLFLARASGRDEAWQGVLRLAPGLFDDEALRAALHYQLARQPDDRKMLRELLAIHERLGDPQGGMRLLEQTYQHTRQPWLLEQMADLAQRAGDDELALRHWQRVIDTDGLTPARAVRMATLLLLRGRADDAMAWLERAQDSAASTDVAFWRLTAELAQRRQREATAIAAYRRLIGQDNDGAEARDYEALRQLLGEHPHEAAQIAMAAWRRFGEPRQLIHALGHLAVEERWVEMGHLLAEVDEATRQPLQRQPDFLVLAAQYHLHSGQPQRARQDLETALRIAPESTEIRSALLWMLVDGSDGTALRQLLATHEAEWQGDPALHDALGAAYLTLSLPDIALRRYYTPHLPEHRDDFLWLMNYADALEQNQDIDRAWQLREQLLADERRRGAAPDSLAPREQQAVQRAARARLLLAQRPGDAGLDALRELLRLDMGPGQPLGELSPAARDLALAWLQEHAEPTAARGWLWQQYARTASRPLWAEVSQALAEGDREAAGQLLERHEAELSPQQRISLASELGDVRRMQSDAFETQTVQHADDSLHLQLSESLLAHSDHAGASYIRRDLGSFIETDQSARWHLALAPNLTLDLGAGRVSRSEVDTADIGAAPDETYRSARFTWRHPDGETRLTTEDRDSFASYTPVMIEHEQRLDDRLALNLSIGTQQPANESTTLRVAGMKDRAAISLSYRPERTVRVGVGYALEDFSTQTGEDVGDAKTWQLEAAYALRTEPRDLEAGVFWEDHRFGRRANSSIFDARLNRLLPAGMTSANELGPDFFLPDDFRFYGVRLSTDTRFEREYTRAWRPFATVARTWHSELGAGYDLAAGVAGSVFGADHLSFGWKLSKGGSTTGGLIREIGLTYRIHY